LNQSLKKILVPLDGSDIAEQALDTALALAAGHGAELHLVSVASYVPPITLAPTDETRVTGWIEEEKARVQEYLEGAADKASSQSPGVSVTTHVRVGRVSPAVQEVAEDLEVDLLVLTTHGRGTFERSWLGSTADQIIRQVEQPLLLLRHREKGLWAFDPNLISHVLVPLDGSDAAECALDALPMVLPPDGAARVTLVRVVEEGYPIPPMYIPKEVSEESLQEHHQRPAEVYLQGVADRLKLDGVENVETRVLADDHPSQALLRFCDEAGVHLVTIATHGRGGVASPASSSVASRTSWSGEPRFRCL
jgi:nucleotide-binding universal stress UspA family protein